MKTVVILLTILGAIWSTFIAWAFSFTIVATSDSGYGPAVHRADHAHNVVWAAGLITALLFLYRKKEPWPSLLAVMGVANLLTAWILLLSFPPQDEESQTTTPMFVRWLVTSLTCILWVVAVWYHCKMDSDLLSSLNEELGYMASVPMEDPEEVV